MARKRADEAEAMVSTLPVFSAATLAAAMTQLSDLSFSWPTLAPRGAGCVQTQNPTTPDFVRQWIFEISSHRSTCLTDLELLLSASTMVEVDVA